MLNRAKRFGNVMMIELIILISLSTCTFPKSVYAESLNYYLTETIINSTIVEIKSVVKDTQVQLNEIVRQYEEEQHAIEEKQAQEEQLVEKTGEEEEEPFYWDGEVLNAFNGVANGPSGLETYYNLPMGGVIEIMRGLGYDEASYPYWVRDDGVKMLGDYVMCAASLDIRPYGTVLPSSLGMAIVCDTGAFAQSNQYQLDIAVSW